MTPENLTNNGWIDISVTLSDGMIIWPGDPPVHIDRVQDLEKGDGHSLSNLSMGSHSGTHIDAPAHFLKGGTTIDRAPLDVLIGTARVIEITDAESIKPAELRRHRIRKGDRILFKTRNSATWHAVKHFVEDYVCITAEGAKYLAERGVSVVGVDYLSVGGYHRDCTEVHTILLGAGVWLIEGLDLSDARAGRYDLVCLPLKIKDGDGAPARAVVRARK